MINLVGCIEGNIFHSGSNLIPKFAPINSREGLKGGGWQPGQQKKHSHRSCVVGIFFDLRNKGEEFFVHLAVGNGVEVSKGADSQPETGQRAEVRPSDSKEVHQLLLMVLFV